MIIGLKNEKIYCKNELCKAIMKSETATNWFAVISEMEDVFPQAAWSRSSKMSKTWWKNVYHGLNIITITITTDISP